MNQIENILTTIKKRWEEAALIIGLNIIAAVAILNTKFDSSQNLDLLPLAFGTLLGILAIILRLGFLKTFHSDGSDDQKPSELLKIGAHFFWRMAGLGLIYTIPSIMIFLITTAIIPSTPPAADALGSIKWIPAILTLALQIIIIKFILLLPAIIIVTDCKISTAFAGLKNFRLTDNPVLIKLFIIQILLPVFSDLLSGKALPDSVLQYSTYIFFSIVTLFLSLLIAMAAVRFVHQAILVYDDEHSSLEFEKLSEQIE